MWRRSIRRSIKDPSLLSPRIPVSAKRKVSMNRICQPIDVITSAGRVSWLKFNIFLASIPREKSRYFGRNTRASSLIPSRVRSAFSWKSEGLAGSAFFFGTMISRDDQYVFDWFLTRARQRLSRLIKSRSLENLRRNRAARGSWKSPPRTTNDADGRAGCGNFREGSITASG